MQADTYSMTAVVKPWPSTFKVPSVAPAPRCHHKVSGYRPSGMCLRTHVGYREDGPSSLHSDIGSGALRERFGELDVEARQGREVGFDLIESLNSLVGKLVGRIGGRTDSSNS